MTDLEIVETLATKVMGWNKYSEVQWFGDVLCIRPFTIGDWIEWNPLQNIADAWQVVEKLEDQGYGVETYSQKNVLSDRGPIRKVTLYTKEGFFDHTAGTTLQEAICHAALRTVA